MENTQTIETKRRPGRPRKGEERFQRVHSKLDPPLRLAVFRCVNELNARPEAVALAFNVSVRLVERIATLAVR